MAEGPVNILLVDDNLNDVELTLHAFTKYNRAHHIHVARDGVEALDFLFRSGLYAERDRANDPDIILLDMKMPLLDGLEVLRQIKADLRTHMIPVVMLSSSSDDRDVAECRRIGVADYVIKPIDFDRFIEFTRSLDIYLKADRGAAGSSLIAPAGGAGHPDAALMVMPLLDCDAPTSFYDACRRL